MKQVYKSKVDIWLIVLVYGAMIVPMILAVYNNKSWTWYQYFCSHLKFVENICRISHNNIKVNLTRN